MRLGNPFGILSALFFFAHFATSPFLYDTLPMRERNQASRESTRLVMSRDISFDS